MTQCEDCPKSIVRLLPWVLGMFIAWGGYLTMNAWANDLNDAKVHEQVGTLLKRADKLITVVEKQTAVSTNLNMALQVHIAQTKKDNEHTN